MSERINLSNICRNTHRAVKEINKMYILQDINKAAFLLINESKIFDYDHFICLVCSELVFIETDQNTSYVKCDNYRCKKKWCRNCKKSDNVLLYGNYIESTGEKINLRQKAVLNYKCTNCGLKN
tara:strand:+ start:137 stop:508 length:372 start_codon:yes stop_codon:yes gene_type:complete